MRSLPGGLEPALGVPSGTPTVPPTGSQSGAQGERAGCLVPIPFDPSTCVVQPAPGIFVAVGTMDAPQRASLKEAATLAGDQGFEVVPLRGKAFGDAGAFMMGGVGWTFYGTKGRYGVQVEAAEPCGSVSGERLAAATKTVAKGVMRRL